MTISATASLPRKTNPSPLESSGSSGKNRSAAGFEPAVPDLGDGPVVARVPREQALRHLHRPWEVRKILVQEPRGGERGDDDDPRRDPRDHRGPQVAAEELAHLDTFGMTSAAKRSRLSDDGKSRNQSTNSLHPASTNACTFSVTMSTVPTKLSRS